MRGDATDQGIAPSDLLAAATNFPSFHNGTSLDPAAEAFLTQIGEEATDDDVQGLSASDLAALADGFWRWTSHKRADAQELRLFEAKGSDGRSLERDILEICGPDMPFLVDSVMGEIGAQGVEVRAMFHPIVQIARDGDGKRQHSGVASAESFIQIHMPPIAPSKRDAILMGVRETLNDVRLSVGDFPAMRARMNHAIKELAVANTKASGDEIAETIAFLKWLSNDHFIFFGVRSYDYPRDDGGALAADEPIIREELNLGILRDPLRMVLRRLNEPSVLTDKVRAYLEEATPIIVAKSNLRSRVHRRAVMDYIGVKRFGENGEVLGEDRFVGLFTAEAYDQMVRDVPLLRKKVERVISGADFTPDSHNDKRFRNIVENYPRDELFQIEEADLLRIALGVQHLMDRPRPKLFVRRDRFDRFISILVFVPRDRYNSDVRAKVGQLLAEAFKGRLSAFYPKFDDAPLARVHYIIGVTPNQHNDPDMDGLERAIADITRTWEDGVEAAGESNASQVDRYLQGFPAGYREHFDAREALIDITEMEAISGDQVRVRAYRLENDQPTILRAKIYKRGAVAALSAAVPIFESMGLYVESEAPFSISRTHGGDEKEQVRIQDVCMRTANGKPLDFAIVESSFEQAFSAVWAGLAENDGFNRLILKLGVSWRDAALIRALARWRSQSGLDPSEAVQQQAVSDHSEISKAILDLFEARFDPAFGPKKTREIASKEINIKLKTLLDNVPNLDADRVLRRLVGMVNAMVRTNYYQKTGDGLPKPYMSFKLAPREISDLPAPKPFREIWVWSPQVEGAHLRFGPVARGGLRWSDRREDFRTEVLGLVKAQQVKNAVIVPVGSKGAFFPKTLPRGGTRDEIQAVAIEAYKTFLRGLLDITDNISGDGTIIPPNDVVRHDGDDPYLVVAADKGTATFSDIANAISAEYGHWLGDAFASGGSVGYDHKKMGITARGAWEAVKRHFREMGRDTQTEPLSVIGVGDMSGDVFGNGMLLSPKIRLLAAFDHRDIFIDPDPDMAKSFKERARMFALPRSSWADYDKALISKGGGVFSRALKAIPLTEELRVLTGLTGEEAAPTDIMNALLRAPCDLMWFGGIGTYVKASAETHGQAGDKANDLLRVNGQDLRCKVIGEGANLGLTQLGRVEAARNGVRLNTDAIDNSAGVDSSDHEVNIKILLNGLVRSGEMTTPSRDTLLASMTDDVAAHVLAHNYSQTLAISLQEASAAKEIDAHARFIAKLEAEGRLDRKVEYLPGRDALQARRSAGEGLSRPELAVITAYSKLKLFDELIATNAPDDPWFETLLVHYFPKGCHQFTDAMDKHRLRREIIATVLSNRIVDIGGAVFVDRILENASVGYGDVARAFAASMAIFGLDEALVEIATLDLKLAANVQNELYGQIKALLISQCIWLSKRFCAAPKTIDEVVATYRGGVQALAAMMSDIASPPQKALMDTKIAELRKLGVPSALSKFIVALSPLSSATDVVEIATTSALPIGSVARLYNYLGANAGLDDLYAAIALTQVNDDWDTIAIANVQAQLRDLHNRLTLRVGQYGKDHLDLESDAKWARAAIEGWIKQNQAAVEKTISMIQQMKASSGGWSFAKLSIATAQMTALVNQA